MIGEKVLGEDGIFFAKKSFVPHQFNVDGKALLVKGLTQEEGRYKVDLVTPGLFRRNPIRLVFIPN